MYLCSLIRKYFHTFGPVKEGFHLQFSCHVLFDSIERVLQMLILSLHLDPIYVQISPMEGIDIND